MLGLDADAQLSLWRVIAAVLHLGEVTIVSTDGEADDEADACFASEGADADETVTALRAVSDFEYEFQMVGMNRAMNDNVETLFLMADAHHQAIASKLVKEIARLGGDISGFVTPPVQKAVEERLGR